MAVTSYQAWVKDGRPIKAAVPIADWIATFRRHGYVVGYYPDERHQKAQPPEDHTPYSHTPWPGIQPYPNVLASDLMPPAPKLGLPTLAQIGAQVVKDKRAGKPGTEWIKYINWTDARGNCWHDEWEPTYRRFVSGDRGHIHVSARTDYVNRHHRYDPVAALLPQPVPPPPPPPPLPEEEDDSMYRYVIFTASPAAGGKRWLATDNTPDGPTRVELPLPAPGQPDNRAFVLKTQFKATVVSGLVDDPDAYGPIRAVATPPVD